MQRKLRLFALAMSALLLLSACGSSGTAPATTGSSGSNQGPVKLVVGSGADIQHFDIHNHNYTYTEAVHQHIFDYLVYFNLDTGKFDPGLATSWKLVDDTTWEFKLRNDVKFHNGDAFTAEDVKYTLERVATDKTLKEHSANRTIKEVQVVDQYTARVITDGPDPILLNRLSRIGSGMLPSKYLKEKGMDHFQKEPIGSGNYKVVEWVKDDHLTLKAVENHWRGQPSVDEIVFRVIPEVQTRVAELTTGGIDIALGIGPEDIKMLKDNPEVTTFVKPTARVFVMRVRPSGDYITADPRVREAIDLAIDDKALGEATHPGAITPTRTRLVPGVFGTYDKFYNTYLYDPAKAKQLLAEAGFSDSNPPKVGLLSRNSGVWKDVAQTTAGMLEAVGFKVDLQILDTVAYNQKIDAGTNPDIYLTSFGNSMKDGDLTLGSLRSDRNTGELNYSNPKLDELINAQAVEMDAAKRLQLIHQAYDEIIKDRAHIDHFQTSAMHAARKGITWQPHGDEMLWLHDAKGK